MRQIHSKYLKRIITATKKGVLKRKKFILCVILLIVSCVTIIQTDWCPDLYFLHWGISDNVTCYYSNTGDALPLVDEDFVSPPKSIHFHETSCRGRLNTRQACAVESAARTHPEWQVNLYFTGPVTKDNLKIGPLDVLKNYENIKIMRLNLSQYSKGTPLEYLMASGGLNRTRWRVSHTSDVLRYLSLYKWGGVYLDLDVLVARSFEELTANWAARESQVSVAAGALCFSDDELGRKVATAAVSDLARNFRGDTWGHNGPGVITRTLQDLCSTNNLADMSATSCQGFEVYGPELFYPIRWEDAHVYFESKEVHLGHPFIYHVWNKLTENLPVSPQSLYAKLAREYCPEVYDLYGDNFGL